MSKYVYLDSDQNVIASSTKQRTLEEAQGVNSAIAQIIAGAPDEVAVKGANPALDYYHRLDSGDGTDLAHYVQVPMTDEDVYQIAGQRLVLQDFVSLSDLNRDFRTIDYKTGLIGRLHKVTRTVYRGEVRAVDYYTDDTKSRLVLSVEIFADEACTIPGYERNVLGQPIQRWTRRRWFRRDGTPHPDDKVTHKVYSHDAEAQMAEGVRRRQNTIEKLSVDVLTSYAVTTAVNPMAPTDAEMATAYEVVTEYIDKYASGVTTFIRVGRNAFLYPPASPNITDDTGAWLDNSVTPLGYPAGWTIRTIMLESIKNISE